MSKLIDDELVNDQKEKYTLLGRVSWWEKKRISYNLIIGAIGFAILLITGFFLSHPYQSIEGIIIYAILVSSSR